MQQKHFFEFLPVLYFTADIHGASQRCPAYTVSVHQYGIGQPDPGIFPGFFIKYPESSRNLPFPFPYMLKQQPGFWGILRMEQLSLYQPFLYLMRMQAVSADHLIPLKDSLPFHIIFP